jgi:membrane protease YdiL (CAAX protease family)
VVLIVTTSIFVIHLQQRNGTEPSIPVVSIGVLMAAPVAYVVSRAFSRTPAVRKLVSSLVRPRGGLVWYVLAFVLEPTLLWLSIGVSNALGRGTGATFSPPAEGWELVGLVTIVFLNQFFFFNAVGEEVGWRGFAMPKLQAKTSPLVACIVIGLFWAPWHAPLASAQGAPIYSGEFWVTYFLMIIPSSIITGWFYNRSQGSILVAGITHAASNTVGKVLLMPQLDQLSIGLTSLVFAVALVMVDRMWKKLPADHPAVFGGSEDGNRRTKIGSRMAVPKRMTRRLHEG